MFGGMLLLYLFIATYVFPLQSRFYNTVKRTLFNAFFMSVRHLLQTIGIIAIDLGIAVAGYFAMFYFPQMALLLILFGMPLIAFVNSYFFTAIFKKYMPKEEMREERERVRFSKRKTARSRKRSQSLKNQ